MKKLMISFLLAAAIATTVQAQSYENKRICVGSGGGTASANNFTNTAVIGQPAAGDVRIGQYAHSAGFYSGFDWYTFVQTKANVPEQYCLFQNYPNPFNPSTKISFALPENVHVNIRIYNILGQLIDIIADREFNAGEHFVIWRADRFSSGIYFYRLTAGNFTQMKAMTLIK